MIQKEEKGKRYRKYHSRLLDDLTLQEMQNIITNILVRKREAYYL
jgi:hypothetical protein